jgi:hypothetical protein
MLQNLQVEFAESLLNEEQPITIISPARHLWIHRNNITANLLNVLFEAYPLICQLVGKDYFRQTAKQYIRQYPSCNSNLHDYGEYFSTFLARQVALTHLPYLEEVAQFEWVIHNIFFAADCVQLDMAALNKVSPQQYSKIHFTLNPACELLVFKFPILKIIDLCHGHLSENIDINDGGVNLLVIRQDDEIKLIPLPLNEFRFLKALQDNMSFEKALNIALAIDTTFHLEERLLYWIRNKTIVDFHV